MEQIELLKQAFEKIKNMQYSSKNLAQQSQERIAVYNEFGIDPITSLATEIAFLWEFIDKGLGSAVGWASIFDEMFVKNNKGE
jgi:hypothetical protein